jgi:hypothetical protein
VRRARHGLRGWPVKVAAADGLQSILLNRFGRNLQKKNYLLQSRF